MEHLPTISFSPDPHPFPPSSRSVDLSPFEFIPALIAIVTIPALIYTFSIRYPLRPFRRNNQHRRPSSSAVSKSHSRDIGRKNLVSNLKYQKETHIKDVGSECPVCLSVFSDEEKVKQLSVCKHSFHATCIDLWLNSHLNCSVCRAFVAPPTSTTTKRPNHSSCV